MFNLNHFIFHRYQVPYVITRSENLASYYINENDSIPLNDVSEYLFDGTFYSSSYHHVSSEIENHLTHIQGFNLGFNKQQYFVRRKNTDSILLLFTYDGMGYLEYENRNIILSKGEGCLIDCQKPHYYRTYKTHWTHFDLHIQGYFPQKVTEELHKNLQYIFSQPIDGVFQKRLETLVELYDDVLPFREFQLASQLDEILTLLLTNSEHYQQAKNYLPENIRYLIRYINNNYMKHLSLEFLSTFSGISKSHLIRLFNMHLHCSPREYIIKVQIDNAKKLLETTTLPANKIADMVGIENENYFRHLFKNRVGVSPGQYRKSIFL